MGKLKYDMTGWKMWEHGVPDSHIEVLYRSDERVKNQTLWVCKCCLCGKIKTINGQALRLGEVLSCGEHRNHNTYDLTGEYGICYTAKNEPFYFDIEDYEKIKDYAWYSFEGYAICRRNNITVYMQDIIIPHTNEYTIDHINRKRNDNRKSELRLATKTQNNQNKSVRCDNTSGVIGVSFNKQNNQWESYIFYHKQRIRLGMFADINDAIIARLRAEKTYYNEFAPQKHLFKKYNIE